MLSLNKGEKRELVLINQPNVDLHVVQAEASSLRVVLINMPTDSASSVTNILHVDHAGEGCQTEIYALAYLTDKNQVRTHTRMHHDIGGGESRQVVKFILADEAKGSFQGELKIQPNAQRVQACQSNRNLLLSDTAEMRTQPQLEIYADDVKASHGATTGQLDESALFYMQQRGIDAATAKRMLVAAFMSDIIEKISNEQQRDELLQAIDRIVQ